jgi:hypothetical protein
MPSEGAEVEPARAPRGSSAAPRPSEVGGSPAWSGPGALVDLSTLATLAVAEGPAGEGEPERVSGPPRGLTAPVPEGSSSRSPATSTSTVRALVASVLDAMERLVEDELPVALRAASHAWDRVDGSFSVLERAPLGARLAEIQGRLEATARSGSGPDRSSASLRAVAVEGLLALELSAGLIRLFERRLSALIRLRAHSGEDALLRGDGRPFLDLAAALRETARAWS